MMPSRDGDIRRRHGLLGRLAPWVAATLLLAGASAAATDAELRGDAAWSRRATASTRAAAVTEAIGAYREALAAAPGDLGVRWKLVEALYFRSAFVTEDRRERRRLHEEMVELADAGVHQVEAAAGDAERLAGLPVAARAERLAAVPGAAQAHFWAAISWGLWGMSHSRLAAVTRGVPGRIRDHAELARRIDESYADAGGLRLLGRLHTVTPRVPLVTGWIDPALGLGFLERARSLSDADPRNALFLAEAILEHAPQRRDEALDLLREVAARRPDPAYQVEQTAILEEARRVLREVTAQPLPGPLGSRSDRVAPAGGGEP